MTVLRRLFVAVALLALVRAALHADGPAKKDAKEPDEVSYYKHIRPILQQHCQGCHQPARPKGKYVMTGHADLFKKSETKVENLVAGHPDKSNLVKQLIPQDGKKPAMPKGKDPLKDGEINLIKKWIAQGAKDDTPPSAKGA